MNPSEVLEPAAFRLSAILAVTPLPGPAGVAARAGAERAIQSILGPIEAGADPVGTEIVVVAEGRAIDSLKDAFRDAIAAGRLSVIPVARTGSVTRAWNEGASLARGHLLAFLDPSCWWKPSRLTELEPWIRRHDLILQSAEDPAPISADWIRAFVAGNPATRGSGVIRRELFEELGGFSTVPGAGEHELWLRALVSLDERDARERFALLDSRGVVAEADPMDQLLPGVAARFQAIKDSVSLLAASRKLPPRYWTAVARSLWERGRAVTRRR